MNWIRNPLKIMNPWWYYVETAVKTNLIVSIILAFGMIGVLEERGYRAGRYIDITEIFWTFFTVHVLVATWFCLMCMYHDMTSHPDFFKEVTKWK